MRSSGGIDLAAIAPRWITLRRGGYITILGAFIMQPWQLLNGATDFLTVVGSFSVFLGPFMGIYFVDYYVLRKRVMKLTELYEESPRSLYWYTGGWNLRAVIAWPAGWWYLIPGLAQRAVEPGAVWPGWTRLVSTLCSESPELHSIADSITVQSGVVHGLFPSLD